MQSEPRQYVDIFLPYYFKIGTLFSEGTSTHMQISSTMLLMQWRKGTNSQ